ncbi:hypothetical protein Tco_0425767 [Tanacetum coccineum]
MFLGEDATRAIPNMGFNLVDVEGVWSSIRLSYLEIEVMLIEFDCHIEGNLMEVSCELMGDGEWSEHIWKLQCLVLLQIGCNTHFGTLDGLDVKLLRDVRSGDDCDDNE